MLDATFVAAVGPGDAMTQDLGARLIRAGLLSREEYTRAIAAGGAAECPPFEALLASGFSEDTLAGFFVAHGDAIHASVAQLEAADRALVRLVPRSLAESIDAVALRREGDGIVVALADPTNTAARDALTRALGAPVRPATAPRAALRAALAAAWAPAPESDAGIDVSVDLEGFFDDDPPLELVRRRTSLPSPVAHPVSPTGGPTLPPTPPDDDDLHVPLIRTKPAAAPPLRSDHVHIPPSALPREAAALVRASAAEQAQGANESVGEAAATASAEARPVSVAGSPTGARNPSDLWSSLPPAPPRASLSPAMASGPPPEGTGTLLGHPAPVAPASASLPPAAKPDDDLEPLLASVRSAATRDEAVRFGCEASASVGRCAVFLALKRDVLQGRDVSGAGVSRAAVQRLWLPVKSASVFRDSVARGTPYLGPYGSSSADGVFQAAIGSRGGDVLVQPVLVAGKAVAVLCADGVRDGGAPRIERIADALGEAFERLILSKKA